jgi:hypothetical protein
MSAKDLVPEFEEIVEGLGVPGIAAIVLMPILVPVIHSRLTLQSKRYVIANAIEYFSAAI